MKVTIDYPYDHTFETNSVFLSLESRTEKLHEELERVGLKSRLVSIYENDMHGIHDFVVEHFANKDGHEYWSVGS